MTFVTFVDTCVTQPKGGELHDTLFDLDVTTNESEEISNEFEEVLQYQGDLRTVNTIEKAIN